jgi:hypothetical protein
MKLSIITLFAATTALIAAETNSPAPAPTTNSVPVIQVDLVEQARLVTEIGQEAAKGFDVEAHARSLRTQIESLLAKPAAKPTAPVGVVENTTPPSEPAAKAPAITVPATATTNTSTTGPDPAALREAIRILRSEADRLQVQLDKLTRKP